MTVESTPGKGATFTVCLPSEVRPLTAIQPANTDSIAASTSAPGEHSDDHKGTVLVIDDDADSRDLMQRALTKDGFQVVTVGDGKQGLHLARELNPVAITLDVMMPETDGWALLRTLKADKHLQDIPVVMLTMIDDKSMGYTLGAAEYLTKPVDRKLLLHTLRKFQREGSSGPILLVDDDPDVRKMTRRLLENAGWSVIEAENGRAGNGTFRRTLA